MTDSLDAYLRHYRSLAAQVNDLGWVTTGSIVQRFTVCGRTGCRCQADPPRPHGPYYQLTRKVAGKTTTLRISEADAKRYSDWLANGRRLHQIVNDMHHVSAQAIQAILRPSDPT